MFDFLESDIFVFTFNCIAFFFIIYDIKQYKKAKERKYLLNIVLTIGFTIWIMIPFYSKYITWDTHTIASLDTSCDYNASLCHCLTEGIIKSYTYETYLDEKNSSDFKAFLEEGKEECLED